MMLKTIINQSQKYMSEYEIDGWLLYDYRGMNPIFTDTVGRMSNVTRPCWLWIPSKGEARLIVSYVDQGRFEHLGTDTVLFVSREDMASKLRAVLKGVEIIAMEYSPNGAIPRVSKVDAGTVEFVRGLVSDVVSSADLLQYATQRWTEDQLQSHLTAADSLGRIVHDAFTFVGKNLPAGGVTEYEVATFIMDRFAEEGLDTPDGPVVAINAHAADPHFEPTPNNTAKIRTGDWILIDLWGRVLEGDTMFADITWTAYVGEKVPAKHQRVFDAVIGGRDAALHELDKAFQDGRLLQGWELDTAARDYITKAGFGQYFNHRLGHSLGREVHGNAVNLDSWETWDTRKVLSGLAVTIEPGIYLPGEFGVRSEIDVFISQNGPQITTLVQKSPVIISQ